MSLQNKSQRTSSQKKRKLHNDSDGILFDRDLELSIDSSFRNPTYLKDHVGHIDLFGEIIPPDVCVSKADAKNKSVKKTPVSRKKKLPYKDILIDTPVIRPKRVFIPTPGMMKVMMESQKELCTLMNRSPNNVSIASTNSLNVSGVQHLPESPITTIRNEPKMNNENNDNDKKSEQVFKGVAVFIDYKIDNERCSTIANYLNSLGVKVEKTFNRKVTHVMFCDGYPRTYKKAVERNIPLVSFKWMKCSELANKILDPADYPPVGMEKYTKTPSKVVKIPKCKSYQKFLDPSYIELERSRAAYCDDIVKQLNALQKKIRDNITNLT